MALVALTEVPGKLAAGETWKIERSWAGYEYLGGWRVTYYFANANNAPFNSGVCAANGDAHVMTISSVTTAAIATGTWYYQALATLAGETKVVEKGYFEVTTSFANLSAASDQRSHARKMLDALEATLEGRATQSILNYEVFTGKTKRMIQHLKHEELMKARDRYKHLVLVEERRLRKRNSNIYVEFK